MAHSHPDKKTPRHDGHGAEEQNLNQKGDPKARITKDEVKAAFEDKGGDKSKH